MMLEIEAQPFTYRCSTDGTALLLIDLQRDFLEPGGFGTALGNDVDRLRPAIDPCRRLLEGFRALGLPIVHTREAHRADLADCPPAKRLRGNPPLRIGDEGPMGRVLIAGEYGTEIVPECTPRSGETVIDKPGKGAFYRTDLDAQLREAGISHLIVGGVTTEVCVQTTLREANDRGYECLLVEEATESYFPEFKQATLEMLRAQGAIVGWTVALADVIDALTALIPTPQPGA